MVGRRSILKSNLLDFFDTFFYPLHPELKPGRSLLIAHVQMFANRFPKENTANQRAFERKVLQRPIACPLYTNTETHDFGYTSMCTLDV